MPPVQDAMLQRRRLRAELRKAREDAGLTQRDVAEAMDWSLSKVIRIESGTVRVSTTDLRALLQHYGIKDPARTEELIEMARASKEPPPAWWSKYREATAPQFLTFLGYENSASVIQQFHPTLVPGLLQEEDYARAVLTTYGGGAGADRVQAWLELRMRRQQELFDRPNPPEMFFVLDEAALHRLVGGRDVMRRQLHRLKEAAKLDNVTIDVIPFAAGAHPGMRGPFVILEFGDFEEDVLYLETGLGEMIVRDRREEIESRRDAFAELRAMAAPVPADVTIDRVLEKLG